MKNVQDTLLTIKERQMPKILFLLSGRELEQTIHRVRCS